MKILLPLDGAPCSTTAIDAVMTQFRPANTEVRLLHVVEWPKAIPMYLALGEGSTAGADLLASRDRAFHEGEALLARAGQRLQQAGFNTLYCILLFHFQGASQAARTERAMTMLADMSHTPCRSWE